MKIMNKITGVEIKDENVFASKMQTPVLKTLKELSNDKTVYNNTLILDDNIKAWESEYFDNIIQSMKYQAFFQTPYFDERQTKQLEVNGKYIVNYLLSYNRPQECNDFTLKFTDENNAPYSLEYEYSNKHQILSMLELLENVYKLIILQKVPAVDAFRTIKQSVLSGININLDFLSLEENAKKYLKEMIKSLGGKYDSCEKDTTHFIMSNTQIHEFNNYRAKILRQRNSKENKDIRPRQIYCLNLKWLFHCYFFLKKMDENDNEYKMLL